MSLQKELLWNSEYESGKGGFSSLAAGEPVGFYSEFPWTGKLPEGLEEPSEDTQDKPEIGIAVTIHPTCKPFTSTVQIIPRVVTLGMGCPQE